MEGEEIVVTAPRLRDTGDGGGWGGGGWGGGWGTGWGGGEAWGSSWTAGGDAFDFGGGGGAPAEEPPPEEEPGEEIVVTGEPPTQEAFDTAIELTMLANEVPYIDFRVTMDGDMASIEIYDLITGENSQLWMTPDSTFWTSEPFDLGTYETPQGFHHNGAPESADAWHYNIA